MLTSLPGLLDTAAPIAGAAHHAKAGAAGPHGDADFAAAMRGAEGGQSAGEATSAGGAEDASPTPDETGARADRDPAGQQPRHHSVSVANLAGFFRSMRTQATASDSAAPGKAANKDKTAGESENAAPDNKTDDSATLSIAVVAPEALIPKAAPTQVAAGAPVDAGDAAPQQTTPAALDGIDMSIAAPAQPPDVAAIALAAPQAAVADAPANLVAKPTAGRAADGIATQLADATTSPATDATSLLATGAPSTSESAVVDAALRQAAQTAGLASAVSPRIADGPVRSQVTLPAQAAAALSAAAAVAATPATVPVAETPQIAAIAAQLATATAPVADTAPAAVAAAVAPVILRAMPALAATGTDQTATVAAVKLKTAAALAEAVAPRVDRLTSAVRLASPMLVAPSLTPQAMVSPSVAATSLVATAANVESQISDQIVQSMRMQWQQGGGEATIELNPNYLGKVQVSIRVEHGSVSASVQAETPVVREWIAAHREELTHTLAQQGMRLDKLDIAEATKEQPARDNTRDPRQPQREAGKPRRHDREHPADTFEHDLQENV